MGHVKKQNYKINTIIPNFNNFKIAFLYIIWFIILFSKKFLLIVNESKLNSREYSVY